MEEKLYKAAEFGRVEEAKELLRNNPTLNVNWKNENQYDFCALYQASIGGHDPAILAAIMAHPDVDVNLKYKGGWTPFMSASYYGHVSCFCLLLKDSRVEVNEPDSDGYTPLRNAASKGRLDVVKWWIASGREIDLGTPGVDCSDAIGAATKKKKKDMVSLLERFKESPEETRHGVRNELKIIGQSAFILPLYFSV